MSSNSFNTHKKISELKVGLLKLILLVGLRKVAIGLYMID